MFALATFIIMFICWILLSGKFDLFHLMLGVISCLIVTLLSKDLFFRKHGKGLVARLNESLRFISYCGWLLYQIVLANFHVIGLAISPKRMEKSLDPHIFTFTSSLKSEFSRFILATSITLTPGTVTIRVHRDTFYIHAISREAAGDLTEDDDKTMSEMERRIAWVFEEGEK